MGKNASAAARNSGKAREATDPSSGDQGTDTNEGVTSSAPGESGSSDSNTQQDVGQIDTSLANMSGLGQEIQGGLTVRAVNGSLQLSNVTLVGGNQVLNGGSTNTENLQASTADSSGESNTDAAVGTGESYAKRLDASFVSTHGLKVKSRQAGFRRAGRAWSTTPTVIGLSELTEAEAKALMSEPMLSVQIVELADQVTEGA